MDTIFEALFENIKAEKDGRHRKELIDYLIMKIDSTPFIYKLLSNYPFLELRNVFSNDSCYEKDTPELAERNYWTSWNGNGWESYWKRFLIELCIVYDEMPDSAKESFWILDTKEKWGRLRVDISAYNDRINDLTNALEMLTETTCIQCGREHKDSKGHDIIYQSKGWIAPFCRNCFNKRFSVNNSKHGLRLLRSSCRMAIKPAIETFGKKGHYITYWKKEYGWMYPIKKVEIKDGEDQ